jgi:hypothetical protein
MDVLKEFRFIIIGAVLFTTSVSSFSQPPFAGLSETERAALAAGEAVTRTAEYKDRLAIPAAAPGAKDITAAVRSLKPNYLVETFVSLKDDGRELSGILSSTLSRPEAWLDIPYVAQRSKKEYDLFDKCVVASRTSLPGGGERIDVLHHMEPFEDYTSRYELAATRDWLTFSGVNQSHLVYKGVKAVSPGNMVWRISAWRRAAPGTSTASARVKAFDMFGAARSGWNRPS